MFFAFFISMHDPDTPGSMLWLKYPWHEPKILSVPSFLKGNAEKISLYNQSSITSNRLGFFFILNLTYRS